MMRTSTEVWMLTMVINCLMPMRHGVQKCLSTMMQAAHDRIHDRWHATEQEALGRGKMNTGDPQRASVSLTTWAIACTSMGTSWVADVEGGGGAMEGSEDPLNFLAVEKR